MSRLGKKVAATLKRGKYLQVLNFILASLSAARNSPRRDFLYFSSATRAVHVEVVTQDVRVE